MSDSRSTLGSSESSTHPAKGRGGSAGVWVALVLAVIIAVALLIFVAQNSQSVRISYLGYDTSVGFGVALLLAAVAGILFAALIGVVLKVRRTIRSRS